MVGYQHNDQELASTLKRSPGNTIRMNQNMKYFEKTFVEVKKFEIMTFV